VQDKQARIESLELEVQTLNLSIKQILAAHKHEITELTAHLEGRALPGAEGLGASK